MGYQPRDRDNRNNRRDRDDSTDMTNQRVVHMFDHTCKGTLARNNRDETLVGVIWDDRPGILHPCIRDELIFASDLAKRAAMKLRKKDKDEDKRGRRNRDDDDDY